MTSTKDHELCSIGVHTHHMAQPSPSHQGELEQALEVMSGLDYVREEEVAAIPVVQREVKQVIYGPLADCPRDPEVVLWFADSHKGLILSEAAGRVDKGVPPAMGRPACAVIPQVLNKGHAALSLGCCGARAYLDALSDSVAMWAFPGSKLDQYCKQIAILAPTKPSRRFTRAGARMSRQARDPRCGNPWNGFPLERQSPSPYHCYGPKSGYRSARAQERRAGRHAPPR